MQFTLEKYPPWLPHFILVTIVWIAWITAVTALGLWGLFQDNWFMTLTMAFGSFIAGATSEGGGAVAFPVMTLAFDIEPHIARDFSFMIQSVGMTAASLIIFYLRIPVEWKAITYSGLGGAVGVVIGIELIAPNLTPAYTKIFFVSFWLSFGAALYLINRNQYRETLLRIPRFSVRIALILFIIGIIGGIVSGITGSGLDIVTFSVLVLAFNLSEKIATPTSVILMASNAVIGFIWRASINSNISEAAWNYWWVCVPIVVIGAPLGAQFIKDKSRHFVAGILYISILAQYMGALFIIPQTRGIILFNIVVVLCGFLFFSKLANIGKQRLLAETL